jgi:hypothetical protein
VGVVSTALAKAEPTPLARAEERLDLGVPVELLLARVDKIRMVRSEVMKEGVHYGNIPGVDKPTLLKPGAELLGMTFQLDPQFSVEERREGDHLECIVTCTLFSIPTGHRVGSGIGSCTTKESKYAYRNGKRKCPECGSDAALNKSKREPGFYCWDKKGGCGATFGPSDKRITEQQVGRVANPDIADQYNTVRKMACKRAHVAAILFACGASELFTQDVEDMPSNDNSGDDAPQQQRTQGGNTRRTDDRGRQPQRGSSQQRDTRPSTPEGDDAYHKMVELIAKSPTLADLEALVPELTILRDEQAVTPDQYRSLRDVYKARVSFLNNEAPAPVGAAG